MNMSVPLFDAFSMEQVIEREQATVCQCQGIGLANRLDCRTVFIGDCPGFIWISPLFIATAFLYGFSIILTWGFFHNTEKSPVLTPEMRTTAS